ncbi:MAG: hypothetical protein H0W83_12695 [Planctomycetes bacterium]|nr:hypothetical protein [Planctomycetota bacterium]
MIAAGPTLITIALERERGRWQARWMPRHRRRYLSVSGPVSGGRGTIKQQWQGHLSIRFMSDATRLLMGSMVDGTPLLIDADRVVLDRWLARMGA